MTFMPVPGETFVSLGRVFCCASAFVPDGTKPQKNEEREERIMEFVSGQTKKDVVEISDILTGDYEGRDI